jgi:hypothetical protein
MKIEEAAVVAVTAVFMLTRHTVLALPSSSPRCAIAYF